MVGSYVRGVFESFLSILLFTFRFKSPGTIVMLLVFRIEGFFIIFESKMVVFKDFSSIET